jgi:hypothetical protein
MKSSIISVSADELSPDTLAMLECLRAAVAEALDRKRKLGQYFVHWDANGPKLEGQDAPTSAGHD